MNFVTYLLILNNLKRDSYNLIFVIVDIWIIIINYKLIKTTINILRLTKIILDIVMRYNSLLNFIIINRNILLTSKFLSSLCYFLDIKQKLISAFHLQTNY